MTTAITLKHQEAHVWFAELESTESELTVFYEILSGDEKARADRFHFAKDRAHFIVARALLRKTLAKYIDLTPETIQFHYTPHGKPEIATKYDLRFNLSHAHGKALIAVTREEAIGVDIEYIGRECDMENLAKRYFSAAEYVVIKNLKNTEKTQAFFNGWARKEAFLKALGEGLSFPLNQVEVSLDQSAQLLALHDPNLKLTDWQLYDLPPIENYAAALAVKGKLENLSTFHTKPHAIFQPHRS